MDNRIAVSRLHCLVIMLVLAIVCMLAGGCSRAVGQHRDIVYQQPSDVFSEEDIEPSYTAEEYEEMGDAGFSRADLEFAFLNYSKALRIDPKNQVLRCKRAWVLLAGNFNNEAAAGFKEVLAKNENSAAAREGLGQAYFQMKKYDQAREELSKALAIDATRWRSHNFIGIIYNHSGDHLEAIEEFKAAIAINPDSGILYNNLGMAYNLAGGYEEALAAYQKAHELGAPREKMLNNLGVVLAKMGRIAKAEDVFREVGHEAQAYNNMGCVYAAQGEYQKAVDSFESALQISADPYTKASENLKKCRRAVQ